MLGTLLKLGATTDAISNLEKTETGKFALGVIKVSVISVAVIVAIVIIVVVRNMNKTFSATQKEISSIKEEIKKKNENE